MKGTTIGEGRYALLALLGEGATSAVYLARDRAAGHLVAVKVLAPGLARSGPMLERFRREAEVLRRLDHPGVVRLLEVGREGGTVFLVMELVRGRSLEAWTRRHGPMPARLAARAVLDVCAALEAAHAAGVVHRDVKPQNVLVGPDGRCRVADFGLARLVDESARITRTGVTMGTLGYMAPEQQEDAARAGPPADVFSVGALLFALLTGRPPSSLPDDLDRASLPDALALIVLRATLARPEHRYPGVARMRRALEHALPDLPELPPGAPGLHLPLELPPGTAEEPA